MSLRPPTEDEIREHGDRLCFDLTDDEVEDYARLVADLLDAFETVREYDAPAPGYRHERAVETHRRGDDPYNAWITRCEIGGGDGPLAGLDVAIKDCIAVAGVEMTCGSQVLEGYTPNADAVVVSRLLDAGARIVGKANMDDMAFTGNGHSSAFGPTRNPHDDDYLSGGSSGGSAIAVATGEADLAIGTDQGGSIRVPSSWCGIVGLKPTHGLVPYTGVANLEKTTDHVGPMADDVETVARALSVIAGKDPVDGDPRQPPEVPTEDYAAALSGDVDGLSIAVVEEGFERPERDPEVNDAVRAAIDDLADGGATIEEVSIPMHADAMDLFTVQLADGALAEFEGEGIGYNWQGYHDRNWVEAFGKGRRARGADFPPSVKLTMLLGSYVSERYHSTYYAKSMNLRRELTERYDECLSEFDLVAMPTTPQTAHEYVPDQDRFEFIADAWGSLANTCVFDMTGHPALSVPAGTVEGLPCGLMLVGDRFDEATVLDAGYAYEEQPV